MSLTTSVDESKEQLLQPSVEEEVDTILAKSALAISPRHSLAQVAPLPLATNFHVGKVVTPAPPPVVRNEVEESYIPVALARAHLSRVVADMRTMKAENAHRVEEIVERYVTLEIQAREQFDEHVRALKKKARARVDAEKSKIDELTVAQTAMANQHEVDAREWQKQLTKQQFEYQQSREMWSEALERELQQREEELAKFRVAIERELLALESSMRSLSLEQQGQMRNQLLMYREDADAQALRVSSALETLQLDVQAKECAFQLRVTGMQDVFDRELAVTLNLSAIIEAAVDQAELTKSQSYQAILTARIQSLETQIGAAVGRENDLKAQMQQVRQKFDDMECAAVGQTLQLLVAAVEAVHTDQIAAVACAKKAHDARIVSAGIQTEQEWIPTPRFTPETREISTQMDTEQTSLVSTSPLQLAYETQVERLRERDLEVLRSKQEVRSAKDTLQVLLDAKSASKTAIKEWLAKFQEEHQRDPSIDDKAQVKDLYLAFKDAETAYNAQKEAVSELKSRHREKVVAAEAVHQWKALGAVATNSARSKYGDEDEVLTRENGSSPPNSRPGTGLTDLADEAKTQELEMELKRLRQELKAAHTAALAAREPGSEQTLFADTQAVRVEEEQLRASIAALSKEVRDRSSEKTRLEREIEQLKLHLELTEDNGDDNDDEGTDAPPSTIKPSNLPFDEVIDVDDDDGSGLFDAESKSNDGIEDEDETFYVVSSSSAAALHGIESLSDAAETKEEDVEAEDEDDEPTEVKEDAMRRLQLVSLIKAAVESGRTQFNRGEKQKCYQTYVKACEESAEELRGMNQQTQVRENLVAIKRALTDAAKLPAPRGSTVLRKQLDDIKDASEKWLQEREKRADRRREERKAARLAASKSSSPAKSKATSKRTHKSSNKDEAPAPNREMTATSKASTVSGVPSGSGGGQALNEAKQKLKALEAKAKADRVKITQLEAALAKAETMAVSGSGGGSGAGGNSAVLERKLAETEKRYKQALDENEKSAKKDMATLSQQLQMAQSKTASLQEQLTQAQRELASLGNKSNSQVAKLEQEMVELRTQAAKVIPLSQELNESKQQCVKLEASYKEEQALRKKYYNQIEDMKGKIRVFARCRPMSNSETERGCESCVNFVDEYSLELETPRGLKPFSYDQVFSPASSQDQVFEDTKNLLQSAMDGYNVCIFAYGQTGSGKTFTMTGTESTPGLTPRAIHHLFSLAEESKGNLTVSFQAVMLELYNDNLIDLFHLVDEGRNAVSDGPKLEIKKNEKGLVYVQNATSKPCTSAVQTLKLFEAANKRRQVGATKMNAESSRSHSVFSILIECFNKTTRATTTGKLSLVDLAGSERAGKTGATAERLKEAQAINKSLSGSLGFVGFVVRDSATNPGFCSSRRRHLGAVHQREVHSVPQQQGTLDGVC